MLLAALKGKNMTCPIEQFTRVNEYETMGIISHKQAEDLRHLLILMNDDMVKESLDRLKEEYDINQKPTQEKLIKHRWNKHG
jgi:hypothetical protein